jgi:protein-tyrosine kinase
MDNIRQAVERAKAQNRRTASSRRVIQYADPIIEQQPVQDLDFRGLRGHEKGIREIRLDSNLLKSNRIIAHEITNPLTRSYDMLRTQILQSMDAKNQKVVAVTSPTPACGKTVTATNLALSISRQTERSVLLVDLDLLRPRIGSYLGLKPEVGLKGVLERKSKLSDAVVCVRINNQRMMVLPTASIIGSAELMTSRAMGMMFQDLRSEFASDLIIIDLPPMLATDDVITVLPQVDCVILVVAVGTSKLSDIEECNRHLQSSEVLRIVVNKIPESNMPYYYGYY